MISFKVYVKYLSDVPEFQIFTLKLRFSLNLKIDSNFEMIQKLLLAISPEKNVSLQTSDTKNIKDFKKYFYNFKFKL